MADDRTEFARKLVTDDPNLSDTDLAAALKIYDAKQSKPTPVGSSEPGTYLGGVMKAWTSGKIQQAELQGLKGFAEGVLSSPVSVYKGLGTVLSQSPLTTLQQQVDAIKGIPDAVRAAATDPEGWGQSVGTQAGTTALTAAIPAGAAAGVRGAISRASQIAAANPEAAAAAARLGSNAVGVMSPRAAYAMRAAADAKTLVDALQDSLKTSTPAQAPAPAAATPAPALVASAPAAPTAPANVPPWPYFLKPDVPWPPASTMPTPKGPVNLPQSFQPFAKPASFPATELEGSGLAAAYLQKLTDLGVKASDAIPQVLRNKALTAEMRTQIVTALEKVARAQAGAGQ